MKNICKLLLIFIFGLFINQIIAQTIDFELSTSSFENVFYSAVAFADIDDDGDQDLLITGASGANQNIAKLYSNDGLGNFSEMPNTPFEGVYLSSVAFTDIDNDGDYDVMITGENNSSQNTAKLYTNDGTGTFILYENTPFIGLEYDAFGFTDLNSDGNIDVIHSGLNSSYSRVINLFSNNGSVEFSSFPNTVLDTTYYGSITFSDVDGDTVEDVLITGWGSDNKIAKLYKNDGVGNFSLLAGNTFEGVSEGAMAFSDVDGDNDNDLLITGMDNSDNQKIAILYINDGSGSFSMDTNNEFEGVMASSVAFSDVDNDGDNDLLITGWTNSFQNSTKLYSNDGAGNFSLVLDSPFENVGFSSIAFSDVDNDGDEDLLITGQNSSNDRVTRLYINKAISTGVSDENNNLFFPFEIATKYDQNNIVIKGDISISANAKIFNITGKLVASYPLQKASENSIPFNEENGIFVLQISNENRIFTEKFLWINK